MGSLSEISLIGTIIPICDTKRTHLGRSKQRGDDKKLCLNWHDSGTRSTRSRDNVIDILLFDTVFLLWLFVRIGQSSRFFVLSHLDLLWSPDNAFDFLDLLSFKVHLDTSNSRNNAGKTYEQARTPRRAGISSKR